MLLVGPSLVLPLPTFFNTGHFSGYYLQHASLAHAERLLEHRRGCDRYSDAVRYTAWKVQKRIEKDLGYKIWALYNDCTTLYVSYWKLCYLCAAFSRVMSAISGASSLS